MARFLYINSDPSTKDRAKNLGCGWMPSVPPEFALVATAPCAIVSGAGQTVVLPEPTTAQAVSQAAAPILAAEQATQQADAIRVGNADAARTRLRLMRTANAGRIAATKPVTAAAQASQAYDNSIIAFKQINALIAIVLSDTDDVSDSA